MTSEQTITKGRISEEPDNYRGVFDRALSAVDELKAGAIDVSEATARARDLSVAQRTLDGDLKARLVDHRLKAKVIGGTEPRIAGPAAA
jgi:hypothetical protein